MNLFPSQILFNGKSKSIEDLIISRQDKYGWEKDLLDFLAEWYDKANDSIVVNTSGSTGAPKSIQLTKEFVAASAKRTLRYFKLKKEDPVLHCLPSKYIAGKLMIVRALIGNLNLFVVDPQTDFDFLKHKHFRFSAMVPNQVQKVLDLGRNVLDWSLEVLLIGGTAVPQSIEEQLHGLKTACYSSYSMTETATHIALRKINGKHADGYYHCLENIRVELSEEKCLKIFMPGLDEPYLQTTDLAELKNEKTFKILGRADHVIISGGLKFLPEHLERKLEKHIDSPFAITSEPHETLGEQLVLFVEATESPQMLSGILSICQKQLDKYEIPRKILFVKKIPLTPNGKVDRKALK